MSASIKERYEKGGYKVRVARTLNDLIEVVSVRSLVYIGEQLCPHVEEYDGNDFAGATHLILSFEDEPVGCVRIRWFADFCKLERMAIRKEYRGGRAVMILIRTAFRLAAMKGYYRVIGHAQRRVVPFWQRHFNGRVRSSRKFSFSDYDYVEIEVALTPPTEALNIDSDPMVLLRPEGEWDKVGVLERSRREPPAVKAA